MANPRIEVKGEDAPASAPIDVTQTPEFQAALQREVAKAVSANFDAFRDQVKAAAPDLTPNSLAGMGADGMQAMFRQLALAIAEVSDQGVGMGQKVRIAPEVLAKRDQAKVRMIDAITATRARIKGLRETGRREDAMRATPRYRAMAKLYLNERLINPFRIDPATRMPVPVEFYWDGAPGDAMRPLNEAALEIFGHYRDWIGGIDAGKAAEAWMTANGLVIAVGSRPIPQTAALRNSVRPDFGDVQLQSNEEFADKGFGDMLSVDEGPMSASDPRRTEMHILGTLAAPAKQNGPSEAMRGF